MLCDIAIQAHDHEHPSNYFRFQLSLRDIEELMLERGVVLSCETIRRWCDKFGASFAYRAKAARRNPRGFLAKSRVLSQ